MNIKKACFILVIFVAFLSMLTAPCAMAQEMMRVFVNNVRVPGYPHMQDGTAYFQANPLARALGVSISWNPTQRIVKINDKVITTTPLMIQGTLYLPVDSIASASGAMVEWDGAGNIIKITKDGHKVESPEPQKTQGSPKTTPGPGPEYIPKPPGAYSSQPSKGAYPDSEGVSRKTPLQPADAPPRLPANLSIPPPAHQGEIGTPQTTYKTTKKYSPRSRSNDLFQVTVTNIESVNAIKDYYKPKPGFQFLIVYISQQNVSDEVQVYTGRFSLLDTTNHSYDYIEGLSNFWLVILRPGGLNFGYLVFEIPDDASPHQLALHGLNRPPLTVELR